MVDLSILFQIRTGFPVSTIVLVVLERVIVLRIDSLDETLVALSEPLLFYMTFFTVGCLSK